MVRVSIQDQHTRDLVERMALVFESAGLAPIAGRILGCLLLCDPAEQSSTQLADWLGASKGSISTQTQLLVRAGYVRRTRRAGSRAVYYAIVPGVWSDMLEMEVLRTHRMLQIGREAQQLKEQAGEPVDHRLQEYIGFCAFFEQRLPGLIAEWRQALDAMHANEEG
jgi:DNA-binding transcriptional regulator GbsR (MarR family)